MDPRLQVQCTNHKCKILCFSSLISEPSCFARAMSTIEDDPESPEPGNCTTPPRAPKISKSSETVAEEEMSNDEEEEQVTEDIEKGHARVDCGAQVGNRR